MEQTKEKFERKSNEFRDLRSKTDNLVAEKVKFENETKKLTEKLEKVTEKEAKQKEQNKRLEADVEKEV